MLPSNTQLSPHFTAGELRADRPEATAGIVDNLKRVADYLEVIREALGSPLRVTSGFRPPDYNASVGGSRTSSHMDGLAADFVPINGALLYSSYSKLKAANLPPFDQLIYYPIQGHIHIGLGSRMRREVRINLYEGSGGSPLLTETNVAQLPGYPGANASEALSVSPSALGGFTSPVVVLAIVAGVALILS